MPRLRARARAAAVCLIVVAARAAEPGAVAPSCERDRDRMGRVQMQLVESALRLRLESAELSLRPMAGCLPGGRAATLPMRLDAGLDYAVVAVCEKGACSELDMVLLDDARRVVGVDVEPGAEPRVDLHSAWSSDYLLRVLLSECRASECAFAVGVFRLPPRR